jgi:hypothetical protein
MKTENAESAARKLIKNMQPVIATLPIQPHDARQDPPINKRMPAPLERALGINQPRRVTR